MKLDEYDRAILRELQVDGRMAVANLATVVGLSETGTRKRLQKMLQSEAIQVVAVGQPRLLGIDVEAMLGLVVEGDLRADKQDQPVQVQPYQRCNRDREAGVDCLIAS